MAKAQALQERLRSCLMQRMQLTLEECVRALLGILLDYLRLFAPFSDIIISTCGHPEVHIINSQQISVQRIKYKKQAMRPMTRPSADNPKVQGQSPTSRSPANTAVRTGSGYPRRPVRFNEL